MQRSSVAISAEQDSAHAIPLFSWHLAGVFLFSFGFLFVCWVGRLTDFNADHVTGNLRGAEASSYGELVRLTLDPRTPAWFYPANLADMRFLRPAQFIWMKVFFDLFGPSLIPFHVTAAVGAGLLSVVFFWLIFRWTESLLWAWLGVILYTSFPSNYFMLTSTFSGDFQYVISILTITALLTFCKVTSDARLSFLTLVARLALWIACIWLAIKLKSSEKILPFVCLGFLILRSGYIRARVGLKRIGILVALILAMMILVIPASVITRSKGPKQSAQIASSATPPRNDSAVLTQKDQMTFSFHWKNMLQRTFCVPGEDFPLTTIYRKKLPLSFTGNYGLLGLFFWISLFTTPWIIRRLKNDTIEHEFWMMAIWFAAALAGFANGLPVQDTRFLNFAYAPSVLLLFMMSGICEQVAFSSEKRKYFRALVTIMTLYTVIPNYGFYTKLHQDSIQDTHVRAAQDIFRVYYSTGVKDWEFYKKYPELEARLVVNDWNNTESEEDDDRCAKHELAKFNEPGDHYLFTRNEGSKCLSQLRDAGYKAELWKSYRVSDSNPLIYRYFKAVENFKQATRGKSKWRGILVYKVQI